ncbi:hypothetical protein B9Z55_020371 [Caenorhabditis nigoni]|uniref:Uncharacterized protein n=1 Tax=Caenorhabditis nigoni TaxID=1611254 RepID=A0A2G5TMG5_9PELO|nr:hypothetical protein B9Z55_020371 [Caenorhabditis nigoni]
MKICTYFSKIHAEEDDFAKYIYQNLLSLLETLMGHKLGKSFFFFPDPPKVETLANDINSFLDLLNSSFQDNKWDEFWNKYEPTFDKILSLSRNQEIVDVLIERDDKFYCYFRDARNKENHTSLHQEPSSIVAFTRRQLMKIPLVAKLQKDRYDPSDTVSAINNDDEDFIIVGDDQKIDFMEEIGMDGNHGPKYTSIGDQSSEDAHNIDVGLENPSEDNITADDKEEDYYEIEVRLFLDEDEDEECLEYLKEIMSMRTVESVATKNEAPISFMDDSDEEAYGEEEEEKDMDQYLETDCLEPSPDSEKEEELNLAEQLKLQNQQFQRDLSVIQNYRRSVRMETEQLKVETQRCRKQPSRIL